MTTVAEAFVTLRPDTKGFAGDAERKMGAPLKKIAGGVAAAFAAAGVGSLLNDAIGAASDLNETVSKSRTIFGPAAADLEKWAAGAAKAMGQSRQQALDAVGTFGNLFVQLGIGTEQAAKMSKQMVELASDFASFHNANPEEIIQAQTAAFRGEYDALQRFVPTINAAAVEQEALAISGKAATKELTLQEKALAVQSLMMKGAGDATGDFVRTSDGLANQQRIQAAQWEDLKVKIGSGLIPVMQALTAFTMDKLIPAIESVVDWIGQMRDRVAEAWQESETFRDVVHTIGDELLTLGEGFRQLSVAVIVAFAWIIRTVQDAWDIIQPIVERIIGAVDKINGALSHLPKGFLGGAASALGPIGAFVPGGARGFSNFAGGPAIINEHRGGELVDLPRGTNVYPMGETNEIAGLLRQLLNAVDRQTSTNVRLART